MSRVLVKLNRSWVCSEFSFNINASFFSLPGRHLGQEQEGESPSILFLTTTGGISLASPVILLVRFYRILSQLKQLILGQYASCRFHPTCSEYALECLKSFSLPKAIWKITARISRCNPMHPGGYDPVFKQHNPATENE